MKTNMRNGAFILIIICSLIANVPIASASDIKFGENISKFKIIDMENGIFYMYGTEPTITEDDEIKEGILNGEDIIISRTLEGIFTYYYLPNLNNSYYIKDIKVREDTIWILVDETDGINRYITTYNMTSKKVGVNLAKLSPTRNENGAGYAPIDLEITSEFLYIFTYVDGEHLCAYDKVTMELISSVKYLPEGIPDGKDNSRTLSIDGDQFWAFHAGSRVSSSYGRSTEHPGIFLKINITSGERQMRLEIDPYDDWKDKYGNVEDIVIEDNTIYVLWDMGYMTSYSTDGAIITSEPVVFPFGFLWAIIPITRLRNRRKKL